MGQKSNILTIRKNYENLNAFTTNFCELWNSEFFVKALKRSFDKKGVLVTATSFTKSNETVFLSLDVFFKCQKLIKYRKKIKKSFTKKKRLNLKKNLTKQAQRFKSKNQAYLKKTKKIKKEYKGFLQIFKKALKNKLIVVKLNLINKKENFIIKQDFLNELKKFKRILFSRRFYLFYDFIKLSSLFINREIDIKAYCNVLGTIFKFLPKKSHGKFFLFAKTLFNALIKEPTSQIKGVRILINGKLKGKLRANTFRASVGKISLQTISANNDLSKVHIHTLYGCFGLTLWVNYAKTKREEISDDKKNKKLKKQLEKEKKTSVKIKKTDKKVSLIKATKKITIKKTPKVKKISSDKNVVEKKTTLKTIDNKSKVKKVKIDENHEDLLKKSSNVKKTNKLVKEKTKK